MMKFKYIYLLLLLFTLTANGVVAQTDSIVVEKGDSVGDNLYKRMFHDETDDLMENHPADDLYKNIWTRERLNPYATPADSLPDSIHIDCSEFVFPIKSYVTSKFGPRRYRYHYGTDIKLYVGDSVRAAFSGEVRIIDYEEKGYGHYIVIRHPNGLETVYAHLSKVLVEHNQAVGAGEVIGLGGSTGRSNGSHLHFEFRYLGNAIDTEHLINYTDTTLKTNELIIEKQKMFSYQLGGKSATGTAARYYVVRKGDTLSKIASRNGVSIKSLSKFNGISTRTTLRAGQRLRVR